MSDRVGYVSGNTNHRDHSQWPTYLRSELVAYMAANDPGVSVDQAWPVAISFDQMFALSWNVKKWRLSGVFEVTAGNTSSLPNREATMSGTIVDYDIQTVDDDANPLTRERQLCLTLSNGPFVGLRNNGIGGSQSGTFTFTADDIAAGFHSSGTNSNSEMVRIFRNEPGFYFMVYDPDEQTFNPYVTVGISGANILFYGVGVPPVGTTPNGTLTVNTGIAGSFTVPLYASGLYNPAGGLSSGNYSNGSATLSLVATEFWPYRNKADDAPIWDAADGSPINDPFS